MCSRIARLSFIALTIGLVSCGKLPPVAPSPVASPLLGQTAALPAVRMSEIHYDNASTDVNEAIEISAPAGTDLAGWQLVLYNGNGGAVYNTRALTGVVPATCNARGVLTFTYPVNGIQNGDPDAMALVDNNGVLVEFLSYGGTFAGVGGPANGRTSIDLGVKESSTSPAGSSLQREANDTWSGPITATFGTCNDDGPVTPPTIVASVTIAPSGASIAVGASQLFAATAADAASQPISRATIVWTSTATFIATVSASGLATGVAEGAADIIAAAPNGVADTVTVTVTAAPPTNLPATQLSEIHYDNFGTDVNEGIEVEGPAGSSVAGWTIVLYNGNGGVAYGTSTLSGTIPATCTTRGVIVLTYPSNGIQNGNPDGFALVDNNGAVVEFLSYGGTFVATDGPAIGITSTDIGVAEASSPVGQSLQRDASGTWLAPSTAGFGACTGSPPPPSAKRITFSGRNNSNPALPVGFQDELFAIVRGGSGNSIVTTITWTSETPAIASVDQHGVMTALDAGTATLRATAADGITTATYSLPTRIAVASTTAQYVGNTEFGVPTDADPSDDIQVQRVQYSASYSAARGTPNWVSYNLEATHFGPEDRCDCFTFDPALPASVARYTTADYTGAGTFAGYGIDRGHLARSFDRTSGSLDNATTFYFTNIIPQAADLNQGPWAVLEDSLGKLARNANREVYVITGVAGNGGTVKGEGKIVLPTSVWKVAIVMPRDQGLANVTSYADVDVYAVNMPNVPGVRNQPWTLYKTTIDAIESISGYDLLALLPDPIEIAVESATQPPPAATDGPYASAEGANVNMSAAGSTDPDGDALSYVWSFGDGASATGETTTHAYANDGRYTVRLVATDPRGLADTTTTTAILSNVAPTVVAFSGATLLPNESYSANGTFTDPGSDTWTATVDYGDGSGTGALALGGKSFALSHAYAAAGSFTVTVTVFDGVASGSYSAAVTVLTPSQGIQFANTPMQQSLDRGAIRAGNAPSLTATLMAAERLLNSGNAGPQLSFWRLQPAAVGAGSHAAFPDLFAYCTAPLGIAPPRR